LSKARQPLTPLELEIMNVLWDTGPANVQTVQQNLGRPLAYTTVQTMLNVLHRKGHAKRTLKLKAYFYRPSTSRSEVVKQTMSDVVDRLFEGSATNLVMSLVEAKQISLDELDRLRGLIEEAEGDE
jgi:BlaI family transcriptional regulator, penicillinase repressor